METIRKFKNTLIACIFAILILLASIFVAPVLFPPTPTTGAGAGTNILYKDLYPTSDITTEWTYTNTPHWSQVDEVYTSPDTADYVATASSSYVNESWGLADYSPSPALPTDYAIVNVTLYEYATRTGTCNFYLQIKTNSAFYLVSKSLSVSWAWYSNTWTTNPQTGGYWTWALVNALEVGCRGKQTLGMPEVADCYVRVYYGYTAAATQPPIQDFCYVDDVSGSTVHTNVGATPYLDMVDYGADSGNNYINLTGANNGTTQNFYFANTVLNASGTQFGTVSTYLEFRIYEMCTTGCYYYFNVTQGTVYQEFTYTCVGALAGTWFWASVNITALVDTLTEVNNTRFQLKPKYGNQGTLFDSARLNVTLSTAPTINSASCNTDYGGVNATFTVNASDNVELDFYMLATNGSSSWVNGTWLAFLEDQTTAVNVSYAMTPATVNFTEGYKFYVNNTFGMVTVSSVTTFWITEVVLYPVGNGDLTQLQPASNNHLLVDDPWDATDEDTTRVYPSNTTTNYYVDFYEMGNLTINMDSNIAVECFARAKSTNNTQPYCSEWLFMYKLNGAIANITGELYSPTTVYAYLNDVFTATLNETEINSLQLGVQAWCRNDSLINYTGYMTQIYLLVHPTIPIFKNGWVNNTRAGATAWFYMTVYHSNIGETLTFSTNNTSPWTNTTVLITTQSAYRTDFNYSTTLNSTVGVIVLWKWFYSTTANGEYLFEQDETTSIVFMLRTQKPTLIERMTDLIAAINYDTDFDTAYFGALVGKTNKTTLQNMIAVETSWVNVIRYSAFTEKYGIENETKIKWALNEANVTYYLPVTTTDQFEIHYRSVLYGFYYAAKYDYLTAKWNWTECYNTMHSACANISGGGFLWYEFSTQTPYTFTDRYYDENAETLSAFLILYEKCNITAAWDDAITIWTRLNNYYWYEPEQHYVYNAAQWNHPYSYECSSGAFLSIIAELRYFDSNTANISRLQTDILSRYVQDRWDTTQWRYYLEDTAYFGVMHHYNTNPQRRMDATLHAWNAMFGLYPLLNSTEQADILAMLSGYNAYPPTWELMFNPRLNLYTTATNTFKVYSDTESDATWKMVDLLFFLSMIPNATLAIPLEELEYMYQYAMSDCDLFGLNITARTMNVSVLSAGNISFMWNQTVNQSFSGNGTYTLTFAMDWNTITSCIKIGDLPTNRKFLSTAFTTTTLTAGWNTFSPMSSDVGKTLYNVSQSLDYDGINVTWIMVVYVNGSNYMYLANSGYTLDADVVIPSTSDTFQIWCLDAAATWTHTYPP
jgi:hypothetical protein